VIVGVSKTTTQEPKMKGTQLSHRPLRELAYRANDGLEVTLFWLPDTDEVKVCVCDQKDGAYFEIRPEPDQALDVFHHPYSYAAHSNVHYQDERLAGASTENGRADGGSGSSRSFVS
jgi:hypothetical protein